MSSGRPKDQKSYKLRKNIPRGQPKNCKGYINGTKQNSTREGLTDDEGLGNFQERILKASRLEASPGLQKEKEGGNETEGKVFEGEIWELRKF